MVSFRVLLSSGSSWRVVDAGGVRRCLTCAPVGCRPRARAQFQDACWAALVDGCGGAASMFERYRIAT